MPKVMSGKVISIFTMPWPGIGDACFGALIARELKNRYPNGYIICYSNWPELFKYDPNIAEAHKLDRNNIINPIITKKWFEHNAHICANMCLAAGFDIQGSIRVPYFMHEDEIKWANNIMINACARIVIHARQKIKFGSNKNWPIERWNELVRRINENVIQVGSLSEPHVIGAKDYRGLEIRKSISLVALSKIFITCDSGLYHVTSGFNNKRNIVLLGKRSHPNHFTYPGDFVLSGNINCPNEYREGAHCALVNNKEYSNCMLNISVTDVLNALTRFRSNNVQLPA